MININCFAAESVASLYQHQQVVIDDEDNQITILFNLVNELEEGPAEAIYPTHTIKFRFVEGIKQGEATTLFLDGTQIRFTYLNDMPFGKAIAIFSDGKEEAFEYS